MPSNFRLLRDKAGFATLVDSSCFQVWNVLPEHESSAAPEAVVEL